jgi:protein-disulfide isomerase
MRRSSVATVLFLLAAGCGEQGGQAEVAAQAPEAEPEFLDLASLGMNEGDPDTSVFGVIEFADFGCSHCSDFHRDSFPALHAEFVATGTLIWKYIPVTLAGFPNSDLAGASIECGGELGTFAPLRDVLYAKRDEWMAAVRSEALFVEYAVSVGVPRDAFAACLAGPDARARLERNNTVARQIGVTGTPTFIVAGTPVQGAPPLANFQAALRSVVQQARASIDSLGAAGGAGAPGAAGAAPAGAAPAPGTP